MEFPLPTLSEMSNAWGPPSGAAGGNLLDFSVEKLDKYPLPGRIGRTCDFTQSGIRFAEQRAAKGKGKGKNPQLLGPASKDDEGFKLVDSQPLPNKSAGRGRGFGFGRGRGRGKGIAVNYQEGILGQRQKPFFQANQNSTKGKGKGRGFNKGRSGIPSFKDWSVQTKTDWTMLREIPLGQLEKLSVDARQVEFDDLLWCGILHDYNKEYDRTTIRTEKVMRRFEDLNFFNVSTSDDPLLTDFLQNDPSASVIATDHVLACLIAASRSVYSWDIVITKISNKLIFDKRDGSTLDFLSVNETAPEPPNNDDTEHMNAPKKLGQEASCINQNFSQMCLDTRSPPEEMEKPNPFEEEGAGRVASGAYRYRKITLPGNPKDDNEFNKNPVSMIVRTEVNAKLPGSDQLLSIKALNEYDPKQGVSWRTNLEAQRGAVLAAELKNNAFKLGRWTAQAILAGCDQMKIGYASRVRAADPWSHTILGVQTNFTDSFAGQIGMSRNNAFGIVRNIIDLLMDQDDGKFLILKDPTKPIMRIHEVPWDTFAEEEDDGEGDEEEEDGEELDDDGQALPAQPSSTGKGR